MFWPWKSCNVNGGRSQWLMVAPGVIQTPWYSNDHLSNQNIWETSKSLARFFFHVRILFPYSVKAVPGKMRKKIESSKDCPSTWLRRGQRLKLRRDLDGCPLYFWPSERRNGRFVPCCMHTMQTKNFKAFPWYFQKTKNDRSLTFLLRSERTNVCSRCRHKLNYWIRPEVKIAAIFSKPTREKPR